MAIYHLEAKIVSRGAGRSAVAAAAYLSCSRMLNEYDGVQHDYTRKQGLGWRQVFLPATAPAEWQDRETLWNAVEETETAKDSRLAREFVAALPIELSREEQIQLLQDFIKEQFVADGMCADAAIHDPYPPGHNPHAHILLTVRPLDEKGKWQYKTEKEYLCVKDGEERGFTAAEFKQAQADGWEKQYQYKVGKKKVYMTPSAAQAQGYERISKYPKSTKYGRQNPITERWNSDEQLVLWRQAWADVTNLHLERTGHEERIDHRSHAERGLLERPTVHEGVVARATMNMTPEEMNTQLYEKLTAEQAKYRDWLMGQPPEEILNHAYEYAVREDILAAAELMDMPQAQAAALLAVSSPMEAIYGEWTERKSSDLDPMLDCISNRAYAALQAQRELPVYRYPGGYAHEHGELEQYRASRKADIACKEAIESAITEHYRDNCLGREAVSQVVEQFGYERVLHVLANTVRHKEWDGRISQGNKAWARTVPVFEDLDAWGNDRNKEFVVDRSHPGIIDLFVDMVRHEYLLTQPLTKDDIRAEAARILSAFQAARGPNSPSGTHFMVQVSPDFLARANSKNQNRLVSMLPFRSLSISTLEGRKGVYALITKDEDRAQSLRLRKPSVRKKLSETKAEPGHTDKKKVREQER